MMRRILFAVFLVVACATGAAADSFEDAVSALQRGDSTLAARRFRPLAEQGDPQAQIRLGWMFEKGQGVQQNDQEAVKWYRKAAGQGNAEVQALLGEMYFKAVPQDYVHAYRWFDLAAQQYLRQGGKNMETEQRRDAIAMQLTSAQIAAVQRLARQCRVSNYANCESLSFNY
jgi:TPR repeat protein